MMKKQPVKVAKSLAVGTRVDVLKSLRTSKRLSFFDVVVRDRDSGIGKKFRRTCNKDEETFFEPVEVSTYFTVIFFFLFLVFVSSESLQPSGKARGQAYGYYTFRGVREDVVRPLRSGHKKQWKEFSENGSTVERKL
jgi:hypothetical protein